MVGDLRKTYSIHFPRFGTQDSYDVDFVICHFWDVEFRGGSAGKPDDLF